MLGKEEMMEDGAGIGDDETGKEGGGRSGMELCIILMGS